MRRVGWMAVVAMALAAGAAGAQPAPGGPACVAPGPPPADSERPAAMQPKPVRPGCIDPATMMSRCSQKVLGAFNAQVDAYNQALRVHGTEGQAFVDRLNNWTREAQAYANCEVNVLNAQATGS